MPSSRSHEVLTCPRVDEVAIPATPSFNCQCQLCGARIWVAHDSPLEPARMCGACSAAHARWPTLSEAEVTWAVQRAADMSRTGAARSFGDAASLKRYRKPQR